MKEVESLPGQHVLLLRTRADVIAGFCFLVRVIRRDHNPLKKMAQINECLDIGHISTHPVLLSQHKAAGSADAPDVSES